VIFFAIATALALAAPIIGNTLAKPKVLEIKVLYFALMFIVFLCSGLALQTRDLKSAFLGGRASLGTVWGLVAICGLAPLLGFLFRMIELVPPEYITGLVILLASPTTLGVGISMTQRSKGNVGLAIALTVVSNALGVALLPLWLKALLSGGSETSTGLGSMNAAQTGMLIAKLAVNNLLPTLIGKALREVSPKRIAPFADRNKQWLGVISNGCLAVVIMMSIAGARDQLLETALGTFIVVVLLAIGYHVLFLLLNALALYPILRVPPPEAAASLILASQKSAPVALTAIGFLTTNPTAQGLLAVPCVIGQLGQVFLGHPVTAELGRRNARWSKARQEQEAAAAAIKGPQEAAGLEEGLRAGSGGAAAAVAAAAAAGAGAK
jgi:sodium/bile acid cotransporter 7